MQEKTTVNTMFMSTASGAAFRAIFATPFDNFAKRSQIYSGRIGWKDVPQIFFQNGPSGLDKMVNAYRGILFGFCYKGMQTFSFDQSFELQKYLKGQLGEHVLTNVASGAAVSVAQTLVLHPFSTIRTRMQVNKQAFEQASPSLKSSLFMRSIRQGRFFDGISANLSRNMAFLMTSNLVVDSYRQGIQRYSILGSAEKLNNTQESLARMLSGCTAGFVSVFFDNIKTRIQVNGKQKGESNLLFEVCKEVKKNGLKTSVRAAVPYSMAEALGLLGFYTGISVAKHLQQKVTELEDTRSLNI